MQFSLLLLHYSPPCSQSAEVWYEVAGELAQEGLRPVTPDQETLQEVLHSHEEKAEQTLRLQVGGEREEEEGGGRWYWLCVAGYAV